MKGLKKIKILKRTNKRNNQIKNIAMYQSPLKKYFTSNNTQAYSARIVYENNIKKIRKTNLLKKAIKNLKKSKILKKFLYKALKNIIKLYIFNENKLTILKNKLKINVFNINLLKKELISNSNLSEQNKNLIKTKLEKLEIWQKKNKIILKELNLNSKNNNTANKFKFYKKLKGIVLNLNLLPRSGSKTLNNNLLSSHVYTKLWKNNLINVQNTNDNIVKSIPQTGIDTYNHVSEIFANKYANRIRKEAINRYIKIRRLKFRIKYLISYLYYNQILMFNKFKFTYLFLNYKGFGLIDLLSKIYNKKVEFNIINLKSVHLNNDILSQSMATKISNRKNKLPRILKKALKTTVLKKRLVQANALPNIFIDNSTLSPQEITGIKHNGADLSNFKFNILNSIQYKDIAGVRFEVSGRISKRLIASKSIFKVKYKGSLKNIYSSYKGMSSSLLRGYSKSSLQYTIVNSKTANGAFGLKGWINNY